MSSIDFSQYTDRDLLDSFYRIDKLAHPANYQAAAAEIAKRGISQTTLESIAIDPSAPRPWLRYWARTLDLIFIGLFSTFIKLLITQNTENSTFLMSIVILVLFSVYEIVAIHLTGTTLGKNVFGISIQTKSEQLPTLQNSITRTLSCLLWGQGLWYFSFITNIVWYFRLKSTATTKWDQSAGTLVLTKGVELRKLLLMFATFVGLIYLIFFFAIKFSTHNSAQEINATCINECKTLQMEGKLKEGLDLNQCIEQLCRTK